MAVEPDLNVFSRERWIDWSPTYQDLTVGNGTVVARYIQIGKFVAAVFELTWGSTTSIDATSPDVSLPVTSTNDFAITRVVLGNALLVAAGTFHGGVVRQTGTGLMTFQALNASGTYATWANISATIPATWTTADTLFGSVVYEAA